MLKVVRKDKTGIENLCLTGKIEWNQDKRGITNYGSMQYLQPLGEVELFTIDARYEGRSKSFEPYPFKRKVDK